MEKTLRYLQRESQVFRQESARLLHQRPPSKRQICLADEHEGIVDEKPGVV